MQVDFEPHFWRTFSVMFQAPKHLDTAEKVDIAARQYFNSLSRFSADELSRGFTLLVESQKWKTWPSLAECLACCVEARRTLAPEIRLHDRSIAQTDIDAFFRQGFVLDALREGIGAGHDLEIWIKRRNKIPTAGQVQNQIEKSRLAHQHNRAIDLDKSDRLTQILRQNARHIAQNDQRLARKYAR